MKLRNDITVEDIDREFNRLSSFEDVVMNVTVKGKVALILDLLLFISDDDSSDLIEEVIFRGVNSIVNSELAKKFRKDN